MDGVAQLQVTTAVARDYRIYKELDQPTSGRARLEFGRSRCVLAEAPIIGHGTGSTTEAIRKPRHRPQVLARARVIGIRITRPDVAVQWGTVGVACCMPMWLVHLLLFRGEGLGGLDRPDGGVQISSARCQLASVDFHEGWMYVAGCSGWRRHGAAGKIGRAASDRRRPSSHDHCKRLERAISGPNMPWDFR